MPHKHASSLCTFPTSTPELVTEAIAAALGAKSEWENMPFNDRAAIFLKVRLHRRLHRACYLLRWMGSVRVTLSRLAFA